MTLEDLLKFLIQEQGLTEAEAMAVAAARMKAQRGAALAPRSAPSYSSGPPPNSFDDGRGVNYGHESPEQARRRWEEQERRDPQGVYSMGGASAAGIFGGGAIPLEDYDPDARGRGLNTLSAAQQLQLQQHQMLLNQQLLRELQTRRYDPPPPHYLPDQEEEEPPFESRQRNRLDSGRSDERKLGSKKNTRR